MWASSASPRCGCAALVVLAAASLSGSALAGGFSAEQALGSSTGSAPVLWHRRPEVAFDGQNYVVAWLGDRQNLAPFGAGSLFAARVDERGTLLDPDGIFVSREVALESIRAVRAPWGTLIVYVNDDGVLATRLNRQGELADAVPLRLSEAGQAYPGPTAACSESDCIVTWNSDTSTGGVALDGCGAPVAGTEFSMVRGEWQMLYGRDAYLLVGHPRTADGFIAQSTAAFGIGRDGSLLWGPRDLPISTTFGHATVAHGSQGYLAAWNEVRGGASTLLTLAVDEGGEPISGPTAVMVPSGFSASDLAWEVDHYRLALQDTDALATLRLDANGKQPDAAAPAEVTRNDSICGTSDPRVGVGDSSTLVVWDWGTNSSDCQTPPPTAVLLDRRSGQPGAPLRFDDSAARMGPPAIGTDGHGYLAAWYEDRVGATGLYTQRLQGDAVPLEEPVLTIEANPHPAPSRAAFVSFVGGHYLVGLASSHTMFSAWDEAGQVATVDASSGARGQPHAADAPGTAGVDGFLAVRSIVRQRGEDLPTLTSVAVSRLDAEGSLIAHDPAWTAPLSTAPGVFNESDQNGVAGFDGESFALVWNHSMDVQIPDPNASQSPGLIQPFTTQQEQSLLFMAFDPHAVPLLDAPISLPGLAAFQPVAMTFGGGAYLLLLLSEQHLLSAVRVTAKGQVLDAEPIILSQTSLQRTDSLERIFATFDGQEYLVALNLPHAQDPPTQAFAPARDDLDLYVASIGVDGVLTGTEVVALGPQDELGGALASFGDGTALLGYQRFEPDPKFISMRAFVRRLGTNECNSSTPCNPSSCQGACCATGCSPAPGSLTCDATVCPKVCPAGSQCTPGLGCVPNPPGRLTGGCGCQTAPRESSPLYPALVLSMALARARSRRSPTRGVTRRPR